MKDSFQELHQIVKLDRKNSSWSKKQQLKDRIKHLHDEVLETIAAVEKNNPNNLKEELGDVFHNLLAVSIIAEEQGLFTTKEVLDSVIKKLNERKPWIFNENNLNSEEELKMWKEAKSKEEDKQYE